jgi:hypothetical protein
MGALLFTVGAQPGARYTKSVEDGTEVEHLVNFVLGRPPYRTQWLLVDEGVWLQREAIVSVAIAGMYPVTRSGASAT